MYSYGPPHMARQRQDDQHEHTFSSYVRIRDVALKTCQRQWTIGKSGERGSGISVLVAHDDDDYSFIYIYIYIYVCVCIDIYVYIFIMFRSGCNDFILIQYQMKYWVMTAYAILYCDNAIELLFEWFVYLLFLVTWPPGAQSISTVVFVARRSTFDHTGQ